MKKRIYILLTLVISLFICCGRVMAANENTIIWKTCKFDDDSKYQDYEFVVLMADDDDEQEIKLVTKDKEGNYTKFLDFDMTCWIKDKDDKDENCDDVAHYERSEIFDLIKNSDTCPTLLRNTKNPFEDIINGSVVLAVGTDGVVTNSVMVEPQYAFYSIDYFEMGKARYFIGEGYNYDGIYNYVVSSFEFDTNGNVTDKVIDINTSFVSMFETQVGGIEKNGADFFNVGSGFKYQMISLPGSFPLILEHKSTDDETEKFFKDNYNYNVIFDSKDNINKLYSAVDSVLSGDVIGDAETLATNINTLKKDYSNLTNACSNLNDKLKNGNTYKFSSSYTATNMIDDLESAFNLLSNISENNATFTSCITGDEVSFDSFVTSCAFNKLIGTGKYSLKVAENSNLLTLVHEDVKEYIGNSSNDYASLANSEDVIDEYTLNYMQCISYLDSNYDNGGFVDSDGKNIKLDEDYITKLSDLRGDYEILSKGRNIYVVVNCEGLLGEGLVKKIKSYLNIIKIAIPIILIIFGIIDFAKALFNGNDDQMKKTQMTFFKRIGIAILIFFVPTIVELLLNIANEVWKFIVPDSCGLF